jgi:hypothetical protein
MKYRSLFLFPIIALLSSCAKPSLLIEVYNARNFAQGDIFRFTLTENITPASDTQCNFNIHLNVFKNRDADRKFKIRKAELIKDETNTIYNLDYDKHSFKLAIAESKDLFFKTVMTYDFREKYTFKLIYNEVEVTYHFYYENDEADCCITEL